LIDDEVKAIVLIILLASGAIAVYPILEEGRIVEPFSELGVLGPYGKLGDYPRELVVGQEFSVFLYVGNHEGSSEYYRVFAKLGDQATNVSDTTPLDRPSFRSWETVLSNESNATIPITMSLGEAGLNRRLVFELWRYDPSSHVFVYHQRWTQLWLNVTAPG
jgi:uncharacterized membrane protein